MNEQDGFEEFVRTSVQELDPTPAVPRDEMWARIEAARRFQRRRPRALPRWAGWGMGVAAVLTVGIAIGRLSAPGRTDGVQNPAVAETESRTASSAYRVAALQHLGRAEVLLTSVNAGTVDTQVIGWATDMLSTTRLLLDSPAADDLRMARLLEDLELLLAQIANATSDSAHAELDLIQHGIEQTDVLPRLRATLPANRAVGT